DAYVLPDPDRAVVVLNGDVGPGTGDAVRTALVEAEHHDNGHVIVDIRHIPVTQEIANALMWELGRAFNEDRTLRLVVRDDHRAAFHQRRWLGGLVPTHTSLADAIQAADEASAESQSA